MSYVQPFLYRLLAEPCCVLEQGLLTPKLRVLVNTQEAVAQSRHDWKIVDSDVKSRYKKVHFSKWRSVRFLEKNNYENLPIQYTDTF